MLTYIRIYLFLNKETSRAEKFVDLQIRFLGAKFLLYFKKEFHLELGAVLTSCQLTLAN